MRHNGQLEKVFSGGVGLDMEWLPLQKKHEISLVLPKDKRPYVAGIRTANAVTFRHR